jgi:hypothetical protein
MAADRSEDEDCKEQQEDPGVQAWWFPDKEVTAAVLVVSDPPTSAIIVCLPPEKLPADCEYYNYKHKSHRTEEDNCSFVHGFSPFHYFDTTVGVFKIPSGGCFQIEKHPQQWKETSAIQANCRRVIPGVQARDDTSVQDTLSHASHPLCAVNLMYSLRLD